MEKSKDPVIARVIDALDLFKKNTAEIMLGRSSEYLTLDDLTIGMAVLLNGIIKGGEKKLKSKRERDAFLHIHNEMKKTLGVVLKGCKDYGVKYGTQSIPNIIIEKVVEEIKRQILKE